MWGLEVYDKLRAGRASLNKYYEFETRSHFLTFRLRSSKQRGRPIPQSDLKELAYSVSEGHVKAEKISKCGEMLMLRNQIKRAADFLAQFLAHLLG